MDNLYKLITKYLDKELRESGDSITFENTSGKDYYLRNVSYLNIANNFIEVRGINDHTGDEKTIIIDGVHTLEVLDILGEVIHEEVLNKDNKVFYIDDEVQGLKLYDEDNLLLWWIY